MQMDSKEILNLFEKLPILIGEGSVSSSIKIDSKIPIYLCKSEQKTPFFLVEAYSKVHEIPFSFEHITFYFEVVFEVNSHNQVVKGNFVKISCDTTRWDLHPFFINSLSALLAVEDWDIENPLIDSFIFKLADLFRPGQVVSERSVQGLWGELFYIYNSKNKEDTLKAWHTSNNNLHDFSFSDKTLEVKSTLNKKRSHIFAIEQLTSASENDLLVSLMLVRSDAGLNITDLAFIIDKDLKPQSRDKLWRQITEVVGTNILQAESYKYILKSAVEGLKYFKLNGVIKRYSIEDGTGRVASAKLEILFDE